MNHSATRPERQTITASSRRINVVIHHESAVPKPDEVAPFMNELNSLIGLQNVKELVYEIYALLQIARHREEAGLQSSKQVYHMLFKGNPGTGKTTVARLLAKMFKELGVLSKGQFIEAERADLVGEYIGHTALKTRDLIKRSIGGMLFIDEAYSLTRGGEKDFGKEAIDTLVKAMEDYHNQFILVLAGYPDEMEQLIDCNPGLTSRFPVQLDFKDYSIDELLTIAEKMTNEREYYFLPQALFAFKKKLIREKERSFGSFSNARYVRNQIEKAIRHQAVRLMSGGAGTLNRQELMTLKTEDLIEDAGGG